MPSPAPPITPPSSAQIARGLRSTTGLSRPVQSGTSRQASVRSISIRRAWQTDTRRFDSPRSPRFPPAPFDAESQNAASPTPLAILRGKQIPARTRENRRGRLPNCVARLPAQASFREWYKLQPSPDRILRHSTRGFPPAAAPEGLFLPAVQ